MIAIASTCATHKFGTHWFQETNPFLLFQDCSKYVYVANTPKQFTTMMQRTIQTAINEKGVAVLDSQVMWQVPNLKKCLLLPKPSWLNP